MTITPQMLLFTRSAPLLKLFKSRSNHRFYSSASATLGNRLSPFDERWKKLSPAERDQVATEFDLLQKADWKSLTLDQKKILYTIAYGAPEVKDPKENLKVALTVASLIGVAVGLFAFVRSFANPPPKTTYNKEWQEKSIEILRAQNVNPIAGLSSKEVLERENKDKGLDEF